jgi:hypothetical protein
MSTSGKTYLDYNPSRKEMIMMSLEDPLEVTKMADLPLAAPPCVICTVFHNGAQLGCDLRVGHLGPHYDAGLNIGWLAGDPRKCNCAERFPAGQHVFACPGLEP